MGSSILNSCWYKGRTRLPFSTYTPTAASDAASSGGATDTTGCGDACGGCRRDAGGCGGMVLQSVVIAGVCRKGRSYRYLLKLHRLLCHLPMTG